MLEEFETKWIDKLTKLGFVTPTIKDEKILFDAIDLSNKILLKWLFVGIEDKISLFENTENFDALRYIDSVDGFIVLKEYNTIVSNMEGSTIEIKLNNNLRDAIQKLELTILTEKDKINDVDVDFLEQETFPNFRYRVEEEIENIINDFNGDIEDGYLKAINEVLGQGWGEKWRTIADDRFSVLWDNTKKTDMSGGMNLDSRDFVGAANGWALFNIILEKYTEDNPNFNPKKYY